MSLLLLYIVCVSVQVNPQSKQTLYVYICLFDLFFRQYQDYGQSGYSPNNTYHGYQSGHQVTYNSCVVCDFLSAVTRRLRFINA